MLLSVIGKTLDDEKGGTCIATTYLEALAADRRPELRRNAHGHNLAEGPRQPWAANPPNWWAAARPSGRLHGGAPVAVASATVATS
jgi:hypothetical protein